MPTLNSYLSSTSKMSEFSELTADGTTLATSIDLLPIVLYSKDKEKMRRATVLVRLWLMIAGLYRRAGMFDDGKGSVNEAQKLVQALETESTREPAGSTGAKGAGWAESKSVEDLWGDIYAEVSRLIHYEASSADLDMIARPSQPCQRRAPRGS
jgi:hypothetical protein